jgi:hypothetical protein
MASTPARTRAVAIATMRNALEFDDYLAFAFFASSIAYAFFPSRDVAASLLLTFATVSLVSFALVTRLKTVDESLIFRDKGHTL